MTKRPSPMKIVGTTKGGQHLCTFSEKSTVDYHKVYQGRSIQFEAKSTGKKRFDLELITDSQIDFLQQSENQGAICFLLLENQTTEKRLLHSELCSRYANTVSQGRGCILDYLAVVDKHTEKMNS
nr:Holliday junction resolvase RecU [Salibacterium salarium]